MSEEGEITYVETADVDLFQLAKLLEQVAARPEPLDLDRLSALVRGSSFLASAWVDGRLVGFARAISDGASDAFVPTIAVLPAYRRRGVGRELVRRLTSGRDELEFVLLAPTELTGACQEAGFLPAAGSFRRPRKP